MMGSRFIGIIQGAEAWASCLVQCRLGNLWYKIGTLFSSCSVMLSLCSVAVEMHLSKTNHDE